MLKLDDEWQDYNFCLGSLLFWLVEELPLWIWMFSDWNPWQTAECWCPTDPAEWPEVVLPQPSELGCCFSVLQCGEWSWLLLSSLTWLLSLLTFWKLEQNVNDYQLNDKPTQLRHKQGFKELSHSMISKRSNLIEKQKGTWDNQHWGAQCCRNLLFIITRQF